MVDMIELEAGLPPHVITRPCRDGIEAEWWARELIARGFAPVILDGVLFLGADAAERDVDGQVVTIIRRFDPSVRGKRQRPLYLIGFSDAGSTGVSPCCWTTSGGVFNRGTGTAALGLAGAGRAECRCRVL